MKKAKRMINLSNDLMFSGAMFDEEICKDFLEEILVIKIRKITKIEPQKAVNTEIKISNEDRQKARGVRFDLLIEDDTGTKFDVEMQNSNNDNLKKRARYYMGAINSITLTPRANFSSLKKSYVIFVCTFDLFKQGRSKYTFEYKCKEVPKLTLKDETTIVYLNTKSDMNDVSDNLKGFLKYVEQSNDDTLKKYNSPLAQKVARRVDKLRKDEKFMEIVFDEEEIREEAREEGREEGRIEGREEGRIDEKYNNARNLLDLLPDEVIAERIGLSIEVVRKLREKAEKDNL